MGFSRLCHSVSQGSSVTWVGRTLRSASLYACRSRRHAILFQAVSAHFCPAYDVDDHEETVRPRT